jgi:DNA-binding NarL/FixJ family response regulator
MPAIKVAFIHPREILRLGLASVFKGEPGIKVVGQSSAGKDAQKLTTKHEPNVLLLFDQLDDCDSFDLAKKLKGSSPELKIVMMGVQENTTYMARAAAAGVQDYLFEGSTGREILETVRNVAAGKSPSPSSSYGKVLASMRDRNSNPTQELTPREFQVLRHIGYGLANEEIARSMGISVETIKEHVQNILRKLAMKDRTQVAVWAVREGLV